MRSVWRGHQCSINGRPAGLACGGGWAQGTAPQLGGRLITALAPPAGAAGDGTAGAPPPALPRITLVAESFGCCLALRVAASAAAPELISGMVLVNSATAFSRSLGGLAGLVAGTNLLSLFPQNWYSVAQTTLLPLLVDSSRVDECNTRLLRAMVAMDPVASRQAFGFSRRAAEAGGASGGGAGQAGGAAGTASVAISTDGDSVDGGEVVATPTTSSGSGNGNGGGGGSDGGLFYGPAAAANFRTNLMREGDLDDAVLAHIATPTLLITSARDRMLPAISEGTGLWGHFGCLGPA